MPCCPDWFLQSGQYSFYNIGVSRTEALLMASNTSYSSVCTVVLVDSSCAVIAYRLHSPCYLRTQYRLVLVYKAQSRADRTKIMPCFVSASGSDLLRFVLVRQGFA